MKSSMAVDTGGVFVSSLCLMHCLFFPLLGAILPVFGAWSEIEWVHKILVLMAIPLCVSLMLRAKKWPNRALAIFGITFLLLSAFAEPLHDHEKLLTVVGALSLGLTHLQILRSGRHTHS